LNFVSGSQYYENMNFNYQGDQLIIKDEGFLKKGDDIKTQFMNVYVGQGLNYQLTRNWQARLSVNLERNFTQNKKVFNIGKTNQIIHTGIVYRW